MPTDWNRLVFLGRRDGISAWRAEERDGGTVTFLAADSVLGDLIEALHLREGPHGSDPALHAVMLDLLAGLDLIGLICPSDSSTPPDGGRDRRPGGGPIA